MIKLYKAYLFRDKSPIIYAIRDLRKMADMSYQEIYDNGGPSTSAQWNWDYGTTRRPQEASTTAAIRAMGYNVAVIDSKKNIVYTIDPSEFRPRLKQKRKRDVTENGNT